MAITIETTEQYDNATQRVQELAGAHEGSPEEKALIDLIAAIEAWDLKHDDASGWKD